MCFAFLPSALDSRQDGDSPHPPYHIDNRSSTNVPISTHELNTSLSAHDSEMAARYSSTNSGTTSSKEEKKGMMLVEATGLSGSESLQGRGGEMTSLVPITTFYTVGFSHVLQHGVGPMVIPFTGTIPQGSIIYPLAPPHTGLAPHQSSAPSSHSTVVTDYAFSCPTLPPPPMISARAKTGTPWTNGMGTVVLGEGTYSKVYQDQGMAVKVHNEIASFLREYMFFSFLDGMANYYRKGDGKCKDEEMDMGEPSKLTDEKVMKPWDFSDYVVKVEKLLFGKSYSLRMEMHDTDLWEFIKGKQHRLRDDTSCVLREGIICDILKGLYFLHSFGIVHGDLAAKNILIKLGGSAEIKCRISDLGSSFPSGTSSLGMTTLFYSSDDTTLTPAHDMFSLAVIIASLWNSAPWFGHRYVRQGDGSARAEGMAWLGCGGIPMRTGTIEIVSYSLDGSRFFEPLNPGWRKAKSINAGGIDIARIPEKWQNVIIDLACPNRSYRSTSYELLKSVFGLNLDHRISRSGKRSSLVSLGGSTHDCPEEVFKSATSFSLPYKFGATDMKHIYGIARKYAKISNAWKSGEWDGGSEGGEGGGGNGTGKEKDVDVKVSRDEIGIFCFIRSLVISTDPTHDGDGTGFPVENLKSLTKGSNVKRDISRLVSDPNISLAAMWLP